MYSQKDKGTKWSTNRRTEGAEFRYVCTDRRTEEQNEVQTEEQMEQNGEMYVCTDRREWLFDTVIDVKKDRERKKVNLERQRKQKINRALERKKSTERVRKKGERKRERVTERQ